MIAYWMIVKRDKKGVPRIVGRCIGLDKKQAIKNAAYDLQISRLRLHFMLYFRKIMIIPVVK